MCNHAKQGTQTYACACRQMYNTQRHVLHVHILLNLVRNADAVNQARDMDPSRLFPRTHSKASARKIEEDPIKHLPDILGNDNATRSGVRAKAWWLQGFWVDSVFYSIREGDTSSDKRLGAWLGLMWPAVYGLGLVHGTCRI